MFNTPITPDEYSKLFAARANVALRMIQAALGHLAPTGYVVSIDPDKMYGNALISVRPIAPKPGDRMISFIHAINYRSKNEEGRVTYLPTAESLRAHMDVKGGSMWVTDVAFGDNGSVKAGTPATDDIGAMVRHVVAAVCANAPFTNFEWKRCATDEVGKWELFDGERKLQTVWKSGSKYGTLMGTTPKTLADARAEAEAVARFVIANEHQERLAGLGQAPADAGEDETLDEEGAHETI